MAWQQDGRGTAFALSVLNPLIKLIAQMLAFVYARPSIVPRIISHISSPSLADLLFRLVQCEESPAGRGIIDWLADQHLIPRLIALMAPDKPPDTHVVVSEYIKAVIAFCSNANAAAASAELAAHPNASNSYPGWAGETAENGSVEAPKWASNRLLRDLASAETIDVLLIYMLDGESPSVSPSIPFSTVTLQESTPSPKPSNGVEEADDAPTPRPPLQSLPSSSPERESQLDQDSVTSSLIHSASILIDLIRKNNSDFTEQQILNVLRKQAREDDLASGSFARAKQTRTGPSVVHLDAMLAAIASRMSDFQRLLRRPRTSIEPIETSLGPVVPLTVERFRICELYAELLHCSNMALLNRPAREAGPTYDANGYIVGGTDAIDALATALAPGEPDESYDTEASPSALQVPVSAFTSSYNSPNPTSEGGRMEDAVEVLGDLSLESATETRKSNGHETSSPYHNSSSSSPSIDSESGHLTRDEMRALKAIVDGDDDFSDDGAPSPPNGSTSKVVPTMPAGQQLKYSFLSHRAIETMLVRRPRLLFVQRALISAQDLFFDHPWNNFLHNVVYDLIQQALNARMDRPLNRRLCQAIFFEAKLPQRILNAQAQDARLMFVALLMASSMALIIRTAQRARCDLAT